MGVGSDSEDEQCTPRPVATNYHVNDWTRIPLMLTGHEMHHEDNNNNTQIITSVNVTDVFSSVVDPGEEVLRPLLREKLIKRIQEREKNKEANLEENQMQVCIEY